MSQGDHQYFRKRVREVELVYVTQVRSAVLWRSGLRPSWTHQPRDVVDMIEEMITEPEEGRPILIERVRQGLCHQMGVLRGADQRDQLLSVYPRFAVASRGSRRSRLRSAGDPTQISQLRRLGDPICLRRALASRCGDLRAFPDHLR
jgi:hypothetical protein